MGLFAVLAGLATPDARASVITQTIEQFFPNYDLGRFGGTFNQFDPSLGTLDSVMLSFSGQLHYEVDFALDPATCGPFTSGCSAEFGLSTGYLFNASGFPVTEPYYGQFFAVFGWGGSATDPDLDPQYASFPIEYTAGTTDVAGYIGSGQVSVAGLISEDSDYCEDYGVSCFGYSDTFLQTTLTYVYGEPRPVPEPSSAFVFATALVFGLGAARGRR